MYSPPVSDPQTKGKSERFIDYYSGNFRIRIRHTALRLDILKESVLKWIDDINRNIVGGLNEIRVERFSHEKQCLSPLPAAPYDRRLVKAVKVFRESLFVFKYL